MLQTPLSELLGIQFPIIQAGMGPFTSAELVSAVSNAGALGSLGAGARPVASLKEQLAKIRTLTDRPFAVNHTLSPKLPDEEAFVLTLQAKPRLISFALGDPGEYPKRTHEVGSLVMHQVTTVQQAYQAAERGVDIIIAQGSEAGGFGGSISAMVIIPQVVEAVHPVPVIAAGGIANGRGLAAALVLGAQGANIGTRFLASIEAPVRDEWKQAILSAQAQDAFKAEVWSDIFPPRDPNYPVAPRVLRSTFTDKWRDHRDVARHQADRLREEIGASIAEGRFGDLFRFTGESAGMIHEILPAAEIVNKLVAEAQEALNKVASFAS